MKMWLEACPRHRRRRGPSGRLGVDHAAELVSVAKSYIGDHGPAILQDCVQIHGGIGVTWDHDLHLYLRRVMRGPAPSSARPATTGSGSPWPWGWRRTIDEPTRGTDVAERGSTARGRRVVPPAGPGLAGREHAPLLPEG